MNIAHNAPGRWLPHGFYVRDHGQATCPRRFLRFVTTAIGPALILASKISGRARIWGRKDKMQARLHAVIGRRQ